MTDNDTTPATGTVGRTTSIGATALAAAVGGVAVGIVLGLRITKDSVDTDGDDWWIVAWLLIGVIDLVIGAALGDAVRPPPSGWLPDGGGHGGADRRRGDAGEAGDARRLRQRLVECAGSVRLGQPDRDRVLAALLPWELARTDRRRAIEIVWWITAGLIAVVAIGTADARSRDPRARRGHMAGGHLGHRRNHPIGDLLVAPPGRPRPAADVGRRRSCGRVAGRGAGADRIGPPGAARRRGRRTLAARHRAAPGGRCDRECAARATRALPRRGPRGDRLAGADGCDRRGVHRSRRRAGTARERRRHDLAARGCDGRSSR